ncbi:hypothetical protein ACQP2P_12195 [Dactylosporangium sp. CA-139114]|uniref:hypothetical protein n=1 Tax=Dactylosporangium sp. CA-139114 TaxID=3239931 RepID=UPI003D996199
MTVLIAVLIGTGAGNRAAVDGGVQATLRREDLGAVFRRRCTSMLGTGGGRVAP